MFKICWQCLDILQLIKNFENSCGTIINIRLLRVNYVSKLKVTDITYLVLKTSTNRQTDVVASQKLKAAKQAFDIYQPTESDSKHVFSLA